MGNSHVDICGKDCNEENNQPKGSHAASLRHKNSNAAGYRGNAANQYENFRLRQKRRNDSCVGIGEDKMRASSHDEKERE